MRNTNGFGTIYKVKNNKRNPYRVQVTTGWIYDKEAKRLRPVRPTLGNYPTAAAAQQALADYNYDPYDLKERTITLAELHKLFVSEKKFKTKSAKKYYSSPFSKLEDYYNRPFMSIKLRELQKLIDTTCESKSSKDQLRSYFSQLYNFAIFCEMKVTNNTNLLVTSVDEVAPEFFPDELDSKKNKRDPYSIEEIQELIRHDDEYIAAVVLILIFTGMRIDVEFLRIDATKQIDYEKRLIFIPDSKTSNGIRYIPISKHIEKYMHQVFDGRQFAFRQPIGEEWSDRKYMYNKFREKKYNPFMDRLNFVHDIHSTRHTFSTFSKRAGMLELTRIRIMGHSPKGFTDKVYTHTEYLDLIDAIEALDRYMDEKVYTKDFLSELGGD